MRRGLFRTVALALVSAALISLSFRPFTGAFGPLIALFALLPLLFALMTERSPWRGALAGWLAWLGLNLVAFEGVAPAEFWAYPILSAIAGLPMAVAGAAYVLITRRLGEGTGLALFPFLIVAAEFVPAQRAIFGGFANGLAGLGYTQFGSPLMLVAAWSGVSGVTSLVVAINVALFLALRGRLVPAVMLAAGIAAITLVPVPGADAEANAEPLKVAVVQGAVPSIDTLMARFDRAAAQRMLEPYAQMTAQAAQAGADLVVWGETVVPQAVRPGHVPGYLAAALAPAPAALVGGVAYDGSNSYNSIFHWGDGALTEVYRKRALVPFNESHYTPGVAMPPLAVNGVRLGLGVCLDSVFGSLARESVRAGAEALVYVTEDSFAGRTVTPELHLRVTAFRAAETGRYTVFANQSGPSAVFDNRGRVVERLGHGEVAGLVTALPAYRGVTPFVALGDVVGLLSTVLVLATAAYGLLLGARFRRRLVLGEGGAEPVG